MSVNQIIRTSISDKPVDFRIVETPTLFRDKYYHSVSYRLVILHAIQHYFIKNGTNKKSAMELLEDLQRIAYDPDQNDYYEPSFLELYSFNTTDSQNNDSGIIMIDRSKGCFPLVLYPNDAKEKHGNRIWGFQQTVNDLLSSADIYDKLLKEHSVWNEELVNKLRETFTFPEKNMQDKTFILETKESRK